MPLGRQVALVELQDMLTVATLIAAMRACDRADLIKNLPESRQDELLALLPERIRLETERLAEYPEGTVGSVMSTEFVAIDANVTALEALNYVREVAPRTETIHYLYVTNRRRNLVGFVSLKDLILTDPDTLVGDFMHGNVLHVRARDHREDAARMIRDYDLLALPVINRKNELAGIVTVDDVLDVEEDEATIDFHKMAPIGLMATSLNRAGIRVLFGSLVGMSRPFLLTRLRMDPATASAPLITSIADIGGVLIYFSIATCWLLS